MKKVAFFPGLGVLVLSLLAMPGGDVEAGRPSVRCAFNWQANEELNVQSGGYGVEKRVRTREYNRLIAMGRVPARVTGELGRWCELNHPENLTIDVDIKKADQRLDVAGRIPNCADLHAMVVCHGIE